MITQMVKLSSIIILQLINTMNRIQCEHYLVDQYIKLSIQKCNESRNNDDIVRLPYTIYVQSIKLFTRQNQVSLYLLEKIRQVFYLEDLKVPNSSDSDTLKDKYAKLLSGNISFFVAQINVRLLLLGLSAKLGKIQTKVFRCRFRELVKNMQIELVINSGESISTIIIKELQYMKNQFNSLQYLEEIYSMFNKLDIFTVARWIEKTLEQKRKQFQQKTQSFIPFKPQQYKTQLENKLNTKDTQNINHQIQPHSNKIETFQKESIKKNNNLIKAVNKDKKSKSPNRMQRNNELIRQANQMRKSTNSSTGARFSSKYTFKSSKKQQNPIVYTYLEQVETNQNFNDSMMTQHEQMSTYKQQIQINIQHQDENSRVLCPATPPRPNKRYIQK